MHSRFQLLFCSARALRIDERFSVVPHSAMSSQRLDGSQKPRLVFLMRNHNRAGYIASRSLSASLNRRAKFSGAVRVTIEQDEYRATIRLHQRQPHRLSDVGLTY